MEKPSVQATVVFLRDSAGRICLARKKKAIHHDDGSIEYSLGMYNGYGGKMERSDATICHTALRELQDESGVQSVLVSLCLVSRVYFYVKKDDSVTPFMDVSFFFLDTWTGDPKESNEMGEPHFFAPHEIPYNDMMPADKILLEKLFQGERKVYQVTLQGKDVSPEIKELDEVLGYI